MNDWRTLGMRATGSHTVKLENVFVPDAAIALKRPRGAYHPVWNVVLTVAMPLIMSVYVGIAEKAAQVAIGHVRGKKTPSRNCPL
jgi:acyl-CoA dehydrogenase